MGGTVVEEYSCADPTDVCCDWMGDTDSETGSAECPFECVVESYCDLVSGVVHDEYVCPGTTICCETGGDTETGTNPCPYECMSAALCSLLDGNPFYGTDCEGSEVCCFLD